MLHSWRISIRGTTEYTIVRAQTPEGAISFAAILLGRLESDLECDPH